VTPLQAAQWLETLARTVHDIHRQGIVHGNLTPANVLMSYNGILKITDIGLARFVDAVLRQGTARIWHCRAPEQAEGNRDAIGPAGDVYGLGAILFTLATGQPPFTGETTLGTGHDEPPPPSRLRPELPRDLETICVHCLHPEPGKRYASALALAEDLTAFLAGKPIRARRAGFLERVVRSTRRWCVLAGTGWSTARARRLLHTATQQRGPCPADA
jgi:serine/threonine-protein kinase